MDWRVRRAVPDDAAALSLVASAAFLETYAAVLDGGDLVAHCTAHNSPAIFAAWTRDPASAVAIAERAPGHAPIGYTVLTPPDLPIDTGPADIELRRIYTLSQMHGTGVGAALMAQAVDDARRLRKTRMLLGMYDENWRARAFYERQGFTLAGTRRFRIGDTLHDDLIYARAL